MLSVGSSLLQARYLAQIVVMGAQVVGRAFARALRQEYAGMVHEEGRGGATLDPVKHLGHHRTHSLSHSHPGVIQSLQST